MLGSNNLVLKLSVNVVMNFSSKLTGELRELSAFLFLKCRNLETQAEYIVHSVNFMLVIASLYIIIHLCVLKREVLAGNGSWVCPEIFTEKGGGGCMVRPMNGSAWVHTPARITVAQKRDTPTSQGFGSCKPCAWRKGLGFVAYSDNGHGGGEVRVDPMWSRYGEFFHGGKTTDRATLRVNAVPKAAETAGLTFEMRRPLFVVPLITIHPGHILVDYVQQLYETAMARHGEVRRDALIVLTVSNGDEAAVLRKKLEVNVEDAVADSMGMLLGLFTDTSIIAAHEFWAALDSLGAPVSFSGGVHFGLNTTHTLGSEALRYFPCLVPVQSAADSHGRYRAMRDFVMDTLHQHKPRPLVPLTRGHVLWVRRSAHKGRALSNEAHLLSRTRRALSVAAPQTSLVEVVLEQTGFTREQLPLFASTRVMVAVAGSAVHNLLFVPTGAAIVLVMQPGWCRLSGEYANQAMALGIHAVVMCTNHNMTGEKTTTLFSVARDFTSRGPKGFQDTDVWVDPAEFEEAMLRALALTERPVPVTSRPQCPPSHPRRAKGDRDGDASIVRYRVTSVDVLAHDEEMREGENRGEEFRHRIRIEGVLSTELPSPLLSNMENQLHVCFLSLGATPISDAAYCIATAGMNYHSHVDLEFSHPTIRLHVWLQLSQHGLKISGSDAFYALDARLTGQGAGFGCLHKPRSVAGVASPYYFRAPLSTTAGVPDRFITVPWTDPVSIQNTITGFCRSENIAARACLGIHDRIFRQSLLAHSCAKEGLPLPFFAPGTGAPFYFLHLDKTGGSTIRTFLAAAATRLGLHSFIPCHGGVPCLTFHPTSLSDGGDVDVFAGHFQWVRNPNPNPNPNLNPNPNPNRNRNPNPNRNRNR